MTFPAYAWGAPLLRDLASLVDDDVKPYVKRGKNDAAGAAAIEPRPWRGEPSALAISSSVASLPACSISCEGFVQATVKRKTTPMPNGLTGDWRDSPIVGKLATLSCRDVLPGINRAFASMQRCHRGSSQSRRRKPVDT